MKVTHLAASAAAVTFAGLLGSTASAGIIGLNVTEFATDTQQIDNDITNGTETFGVGVVYGVNTTVTNWTNTGATSASNLIWDSGAASTVNATTTQPNGKATFNAFYGDTALRGGLDDYTPTATPTSIGFTNLNANFPDGYFAIAYVMGFSTNDGASIGDGTTTYYFRPIVPTEVPTSYTQTTQTSDAGTGANPFAHYAVFGSDTSPLTSDSITFTLDTIRGGGSALGGVQLVAIPEPTSVALLGLGGLFLRRRARA